MWLLRTLPNNVLCHVGIKYGLKGTNACITNHSAGGTLAVIEAAEALRQGEADRVVAIGHDAPIEPQMVLYYHQCGLLAPDAIRPFDAAARRQRIRRRRGRAGARDREMPPRSATPPVLGEVLGGGYAAEGDGTARDPRRRRRSRARDHARRWPKPGSRRRTSA